MLLTDAWHRRQPGCVCVRTQPAQRRKLIPGRPRTLKKGVRRIRRSPSNVQDQAEEPDKEVPYEQTTGEPGGGEGVSEAQLLQELNSAPGTVSSTANILMGYEEQDWAIDGLDGFARSRVQQLAERKASHGAASSSGTDAAAPAPASRVTVGSGGLPRTVYASAMPAGIHASSSSSSSGSGDGGTGGNSPSAVELDPLYARRNPGVVEALQMLKRPTRVRGDGGGTLEELEQAEMEADKASGLSSVSGSGGGVEEEEEAWRGYTGADAVGGFDGEGGGVSVGGGGDGLDWGTDEDEVEEEQLVSGGTVVGSGSDGSRSMGPGLRAIPTVNNLASAVGGEAGNGGPGAGGHSLTQPPSAATARSKGPEKGSKGAERVGTDAGPASWADSLRSEGFVLRQSADGGMYLERVPTLAPSRTHKQQQPRSASVNSSSSSSSSKTAQPALRTAPAAVAAPPPPPPAVLAAAAASLVPRKDARPKLKQALRVLDTPEQVLDVAAALYPVWASCGCRLAAPELLTAMMHTYKQATDAATQRQQRQAEKRSRRKGGRGNAAQERKTPPSAFGSAEAASLVPTPAEAAQILQGVAVAVRRAGWGRARCLNLCSDARVVGLVEALRVVPPRLAAEQEGQEQLSRAFFRSARTYWLDHGGGGAGEAAAGSTANNSSSNSSSSSSSGSSRSTNGSSNGTTESAAQSSSSSRGSDSTSNSSDSSNQPMDVYQQTLRKFLAQQEQGGGAVSDGAMARAHAGAAVAEAQLKERRKSVTHKAFIAAVWSLAVLGGPTLYATEVEALLQIAKAGGSTWRFYEGEGANLAWALAASRHWSAQLADLEEGLVQSGGIPALLPADAVRVLWAFTTLGGPPSRKLLSTLHPQWQWRVPERPSSATTGTPPTAAAPASRGRATPRGASSHGNLDSGGGGWDLGEDPVPKQSLLADPPTTPTAPSSTASRSSRRSARNTSAAPWSSFSNSAGLSAQPSGDLSSFTTSQLAGCCWALAVVPRGVEHPAFVSAWVHLLERLAGVRGEGRQGRFGALRQQQQQQQEALAGCNDAVLSQIWQAAMAVRLEASWARHASLHPNNNHQQQQQQQASINSTSSTATTIAAALSPLITPITLHHHNENTQDHRESTSPTEAPNSHHQQRRHSSPSPGTGLSTIDRTPPSPETLDGAQHALMVAQSAFLRASRALRGAGGHSSYQRSMANCLTGMRLMHVLEDSSSGYSVDVSLPHLKLAIEADGPTHFSRTPGPPKPLPSPLNKAKGGAPTTQVSPPVVTGPTAMKRRHLRAMGWALVCVPFTVWDRLGSEASRQQFLQQRISQAVAERMDAAAAPPVGRERS